MVESAVFADSYRQAREHFLRAARRAGAKHQAYHHPTERGPAGEPLFLDVSVLGPGNAARVFVVGSGTHGIEGYSGSAVQCAWLRGRPRLPRGTAVVFFHALNPWGFAHKTRVTEENVDLNRNFIDFSGPAPANPGYDELHPQLVTRTWDEASVAAIFARLDAFRGRVGEKAVERIVVYPPTAGVQTQGDPFEPVRIGGLAEEGQDDQAEHVERGESGHEEGHDRNRERRQRRIIGPLVPGAVRQSRRRLLDVVFDQGLGASGQEKDDGREYAGD